MKDNFPKGITSRITEVYLRKTDGTPYTGLTHATAGLQAYYKRNTASALVAVALVDIVTLGTYVSGGFKEISAALAPGLYEVHLPNAMHVTGADAVVLAISGASGTLDDLEPNNSEFKLDDAVRWYEGGAVWVDNAFGSAGTVIGVNGTKNNPADSIADAKTIADAIGVREYRVGGGSGAAVYSLGADHPGWRFVAVVGEPQLNCANYDVANAYAEGVKLTGNQGGTGNLTTRFCTLSDFSKMRGKHFFPALDGDLSADGDCFFFIPASNIPGTGRSTFTVPAGASNQNIRGILGGLEIAGMNAATVMSIDVLSGIAGLDDTNLGGELRYRDGGDGLERNDNGLVTVKAFEGDETRDELLRTIRAALFGLLTGYPDGPGLFMSKDGSKPRITSTPAGDGNRSAVVVDGKR